jgi:hypothetical protein
MFTNFMDYITENKIVEIQSPQIFTDKPAFWEKGKNWYL